MNISENAEAFKRNWEKNIHRSKTETHLEGLLVQTNDLLGLYPDWRLIKFQTQHLWKWFYHVSRMSLYSRWFWEMKQIFIVKISKPFFFTERLMRISRYFDMLTTLSIMEDDGWKWINTWSSETLWLLRAVFKAPSIEWLI
jgi:tryptophan 2,3-dioxygenase